MKLQNPDQIIIQTKRLVESDRQSEIRLNANGGNSILIICDPQQEGEFIDSIMNQMGNDTYQIIDLNDIITKYVDSNGQLLEDLFDLLKGSVPQIFRSTDDSDHIDLFKFIIRIIDGCFENNRIPVLINSGALYGSGIENINLMEHEIVMRSKLPLIILYPATKQGDQILFLSKRPASKYRCMIVNDRTF